MTYIRLLAEWTIQRSRLARAKISEGILRRQLAEMVFPVVGIGTTYSEDGVLKIVTKNNYTLDKDKEKILDALTALHNAYPNAPVSDLISWNPKLNEKAYEAMPDEAKALLNHVITIKEGMPQLSFAAEKEEA